MRLYFPTQSCSRWRAHNGSNMFEGKLSLLSTTTSSPFIHAGLPASSFQTARKSRSLSSSILSDVSCQHFKHFKHRHDLSLLHTSALACSTLLPSHFKHGHDLSLLHTSALACQEKRSLFTAPHFCTRTPGQTSQSMSPTQLCSGIWQLYESYVGHNV